jgi:hypothetical protein
MPIIIDEIVVTVEVTDRASCDPAPPPLDADLQEVIVQRCVERVLEILRERTVVRSAADE